MPMNLEAVGAVSNPNRISWTSKDALLYALGTGAGQVDPTGFELEFTTENSQNVEQKVLPTMPVVLGMGGGPGLPSWGEFDFRMLLHGEQGVTVHGPIPADGEVDTITKIVGIYDKGKAAVVRLESESTYVGNGRPAFTTRFAAFIRGEGGFGESRGPEIADPPKMPDRKADHEVTYATRPDQALLYRLSGDRNPLHSDPSIAKFAGFDRPILHGLCTYGVTGRALLHELCGSDVAKFGSMDARFSKPVYPG
ncbi:MAG TPA: MaoC/PaaZ C-terminal domain-containing protein, partial [Acidimicrobiia bacterium]|nr:MaoC/PaaZ C-terminal domain-containing protein [Acidimicrobiia bacterium]